VPLNYGDVPTWVALVGTVAAFGTALWQIRTERTRRHELESVERRKQHRAHATLISAMLGPVELENYDDPLSGRTAIDSMNSSSEPAYNVLVGLVFIQGAAPHTTEEMMKLRLGGDVSNRCPRRRWPFSRPADHAPGSRERAGPVSWEVALAPRSHSQTDLGLTGSDA